MTKGSIAWLPILTVLGCVGTDTEDRETVVWNMNVSGWGAGRPIEGATVSVENTRIPSTSQMPMEVWLRGGVRRHYGQHGCGRLSKHKFPRLYRRQK